MSLKWNFLLIRVCYNFCLAPNLNFVAGPRPVFSREEGRKRMGLVVSRALGGTITKRFGPVLMILENNKFKV